MGTAAASEHASTARPRIRRAWCLVAYWGADGFVIENYLSGGQIITQPALAQAIHGLDGFSEWEAVHDRFARLGCGDEVLLWLIDQNILVEEGSPLAHKECAVDAWKWGHNARYFHFSTQQVNYTFDFDVVRDQLERKARTDPPPSPFKSYDEVPRIHLPGTFKDPVGDFWCILMNRRTVREFEREPIDCEQLATILQWTWGMTRYFDQSRLDRRVIKTSPSGGARHPIEVYPVIQRVRDVRPGIYHYAVESNSLELLRTGLFEERMAELFCGQDWVRDAAVLFFFTAVLPRSMWKYDHARAYRVVQSDAGHVGQTFHLVCTARRTRPVHNRSDPGSGD